VTEPVAITAVPTLAELLREPGRVKTLPIGTLLALMAGAASCAAVISAELASRGTLNECRTGEPEEDRWLTPEEAAPILRRDRRWIYRNKRHLPFVKKISARSLLCSEAGIRRWIATRKA